jgi:DsbC/DsbD-like thiol-disulfide interchange protein
VQKLFLSLTAAAFLSTGFLVFAQKLPWQASESGERQPQSVRFLYPEQITLTPGKETEVDLHFRVNDGLHINSHAPRDKSLIPTQLAVEEPNGLKVVAVDFPSGTDYSFPATPNDKLSVYTGEFVLHAHFIAQPGDHLLQGVLRYQACDTNSCYPPRKAPVAIDVIAK